jgi:signal transduction histidine kinase
MLRPNLKLSQKGMILVCFPLLFEFIFVGSLEFLLIRAEQQAEKERHSKAVIAQCNSLIQDLAQSSMALFAYVASGKSSAFAERYQQLVDAVPDDLKKLEILLGPDGKNSEMMRQISQESTQFLEFQKEAKMAADNPAAYAFLYPQDADNDANAERRRAEQQLLPLVQKMVSQLSATTSVHKRMKTVNELARKQSEMQVQICLFAGMILNVLMAFALAKYFNDTTSKRLAILTENSQKLARGQELGPPLSGGDEIAMVDATFHQMADTLKALESNMQDFFRMISHDLRNPLSSIQLFLDSVVEGLYDEQIPKLHERARSAETATARMIEMVSSILDLEKMEAGQLNLQLESVPVLSLVNFAIVAVQELAEKKQIEIIVSGDDCELLADAGFMNQALINLIANAIRFSPPGEKINIELSASANEVEIAIVDRGPGISPELQEMVFEKFKQVSSGSAAPRKGTGLGLPIARSIVTAHNGKIGVESDGKSGSKFWLLLPRALQSNQQVDPPLLQGAKED